MFDPALSDAIDELYAAALDAERWPDALHKAALAVGGVGAVMIPYSARTHGVVVSPRMEEAARDYAADWWRFDRAIEAGGRRTGVITDGDLFRPEEIARDPFHQDFRRRHGIGGFAAQILPFSDDGRLSFSVQRAWDRDPFGADELRALGAIGRHAARAVVLAERLSAARQKEADVLQALGRVGLAALVVRPDGTVLCINDPAERLLRGERLVKGGRLRAASSRDQEVIERLLRAATRRDGGDRSSHPVPIGRAGGRKPLLVEAVPLGEGANSRIEELLGRSAALVLVTDPEADLAGDPKRGLRALGLTPSEARVAALVGAGSAPAEAAAELGLSTETVRSVLRTVFAKLGVSRQSELALLVARLAFPSRA